MASDSRKLQSGTLKVNTCLTDLDLSDNCIGDSGAAAISEALKVNTCLTDLNLSSNGISRSVAAAIFEACRANQQSKFFDGDCDFDFYKENSFD